MGWVLRTLKTWEIIKIVTFFKLLMLPHLEYCSVLTVLFKAGEISNSDYLRHTASKAFKLLETP